MFDLLLRLNGDCPVRSVQGRLTANVAIENHTLSSDPSGQGMVDFTNGVVAYLLNSERGFEIDAVCEHDVLTALRNCKEWRLREVSGSDSRGRDVLTEGSFPAFDPADATHLLVDDLADALDGSHPSRGGVQVARAGIELIFALIESHQRGGVRVEVPLAGSRYRLQRQIVPRQPRYVP